MGDKVTGRKSNDYPGDDSNTTESLSFVDATRFAAWPCLAQCSRRFRPDSDIDVLVEFEPDAHVGWEFIDIQDNLAHLLNRKVDLHTPFTLSPYFPRRSFTVSAGTV